MKLKFIIVCLFSFGSFCLLGQTELQVVTKTIENEIKFKDNYSIHITGEKAEIEFVKTDENVIRFTVLLIAKNPDLNQAKVDIEKHEFVVDRVGKTVYLRNFVSLKSGEEKPESNLKVEYLIYAPISCNISLENKFCTTIVNGFENEIEVNSSLSNLNIKDHSGTLQIEDFLGEINIENGAGNYEIDAKRSAIKLKNIKGEFKIESKYGEIEIEGDPSLYNINIKGSGSEVKYIESINGKVHSENLSGELQLGENQK